MGTSFYSGQLVCCVTTSTYVLLEVMIGRRVVVLEWSAYPIAQIQIAWCLRVLSSMVDCDRAGKCWTGMKKKVLKSHWPLHVFTASGPTLKSDPACKRKINVPENNLAKWISTCKFMLSLCKEIWLQPQRTQHTHTHVQRGGTDSHTSSVSLSSGSCPISRWLEDACCSF